MLSSKVVVPCLHDSKLWAVSISLYSSAFGIRPSLSDSLPLLLCLCCFLASSVLVFHALMWVYCIRACCWAVAVGANIHPLLSLSLPLCVCLSSLPSLQMLLFLVHFLPFSICHYLLFSLTLPLYLPSSLILCHPFLHLCTLPHFMCSLLPCNFIPRICKWGWLCCIVRLRWAEIVKNRKSWREAEEREEGMEETRIREIAGRKKEERNEMEGEKRTHTHTPTGAVIT